MKLLLLTATLAFFTTSCRTFVPLDPNTHEPCARMLPAKASTCGKTASCGCISNSK